MGFFADFTSETWLFRQVYFIDYGVCFICFIFRALEWFSCAFFSPLCCVRGYETGVLSGVSVAQQAPPLSLLFFADDSLLFGSANERECEGPAQAIEVYSTALGQRINFEKSDIFSSSNTKVG